MKRNQPQHLSWFQVANILASPSSPYSNSSKGTVGKKLRIKIIDTVFLDFPQNNGGDTSISVLHNHNETPPVVPSSRRCVIQAWVFTSKKGEATKRKKPSALTLQHIFDRFSRFALANPANATGPRIVAVGFGSSDKDGGTNDDKEEERVNLTVAQFQREVKNQSHNGVYSGVALMKYYALQCYMRPIRGKDHFFRAIFRRSHDSDSNMTKTPPSPPATSDGKMNGKIDEGNDKHNTSPRDTKNDILVYLIEDNVVGGNVDHELAASATTSSSRQIGKQESSFGWIRNEVELSVLRIVQHVEETLHNNVSSNNAGEMNLNNGTTSYKKPKILSLTADFVMDDTKQLWLASVSNVTIKSMQQVNDRTQELHRKRTNELTRVSTPDLILPPLFSNTDLFLKDHTQCRYVIDDEGTILSKILQLGQGDNGCMIKNKEDPNDMTINKKKDQVEFPIQEHIGQKKLLREECNSSPKKELNEQLNRQVSSNIALNIAKGQSGSKPVTKANICTTKEKLPSPSISKSMHDCMILHLEDELKNTRDQLEEVISMKLEIEVKLESTLVEMKATNNLAEKEKDAANATTVQEGNIYEKIIAQLRCVNQVLTADLKVQQEQVTELRETSMVEIESRLKTEIEAATSQELVKVGLSTAQGIASCEKKWKKRLEEIHMEHNNEIVCLKEDHQKVVCSKLTACKSEMQRVQLDAITDLEKKYLQATQNTLQNEKKERLIVMKKEAKKWEQMMAEMKIQIRCEFEDKHHTFVLERDNQWKEKLNFAEQSKSRALHDARRTTENELHKILREQETKIASEKIQLENNHQADIQKALEDAETKSISILKEKEIETLDLLEKEKKKLTERIMVENNQQIRKAVEQEHEFTKKLQNDIEILKTEHKLEIDKVKNSASNELKACVKDVEATATRRRENDKKLAEIEHSREMGDMQIDYENRVDKSRQEAIQEIAVQMKTVKEGAEIATNEVMHTLMTEHEERTQQLEYDLTWANKQHEIAQKGFKQLKEKIDNDKEKDNDFQHDLEKVRLEAGYSKFVLTCKALSKLEKCRVVFQSAKDEEIATLTGEMKCKYENKQYKLEKNVTIMKKRTTSCEERLKMVNFTLLNHKRDVLIQNKVKGKDISSKLEITVRKINGMESKRQEHLLKRAKLEDGMRDIEKQLQAHSQISALQGGRINISHARTKRRLDEEYESILSCIESMREDLTSLDDAMNSLIKEKDVANEEMRKVERSLVEVLVGQQKKLLSIISRDEGTDDISIDL